MKLEDYPELDVIGGPLKPAVFYLGKGVVSNYQSYYDFFWFEIHTDAVNALEDGGLDRVSLERAGRHKHPNIIEACIAGLRCYDDLRFQAMAAILEADYEKFKNSLNE